MLCSKILKIFKKKNFKTKSKITFIKDRPGHDRRYALDSNKIIKQLNWTRKTNIIGILRDHNLSRIKT